MTTEKKDIRDLTYSELEAFLIQNNQQKFRAKQIYLWLWKNNITSFNEMNNIPKNTKELLSENFLLNKLRRAGMQQSIDGTIKQAFQLHDEQIIESVLIPSKERVTVCISTQAGCALNCAFCATGKMGFGRNLSVGEIFDQVYEMQQICYTRFSTTISNIVVMGMGEPLLNYQNTLEAINIICSEYGIKTSEHETGYSPARITVSTVGLAAQIKKLADDNVKFNLAVSLHTADNNIRNSLMPINRSNNLEMLAEAIIYFYEKTKNRVTLEYLLISDKNDNITDARKLAEYCKQFPCKINLIEYNPISQEDFKKPSKEKLEAFYNFLIERNMVVNIRKSKGGDIAAACGQLAAKTSQNKNISK